jgi:hypothetical protein
MKKYDLKVRDVMTNYIEWLCGCDASSPLKDSKFGMKLTIKPAVAVKKNSPVEQHKFLLITF